ncbi:MAG: alpha-amylase [Flavobacteriaceae bacterium]|nr:alpha-amylase [Flavobacteriaceae bacterium]
MKKLLFLFVPIILFSCQENKPKKPVINELPPISDAVLETAVIYEANIRQYSVAGTFNEFTKDIPKLKKLGVKIIWVMPIFPISKTKRKATGGDFASLIKDPEERKKALGSYYAVSDFTKVNPEFGTIEDFRTLLNTAHQNGMYVILDWVPNHTGWNHIWLKTNPEFYTKNTQGEITEPLKADGSPVGWADVADLNYDNKGLRKEMVKEMNYWLTQEDVDGFRCDVAGSVPTDFWQEAIPQLRAKKDIFMLAEAWEPALLKDHLFDMAYSWDTHHKMNAMAQGKENVKAWDNRMTQIDTLYEKDDILMNFITNHDENSWNGSVKERMGNASEAMLALSYAAPGMPLIYSGQEYDLNKRLLFFEKDTIPKTKGKVWPLLAKLGALKANNKALNGGKKAALYTRLKTSNNESILAFLRKKDTEELIYMANLSSNIAVFKPEFSGVFTDALTGSKVVLKRKKEKRFAPWEYHILIK